MGSSRHATVRKIEFGENVCKLVERDTTHSVGAEDCIFVSVAVYGFSEIYSLDSISNHMHRIRRERAIETC